MNSVAPIFPILYLVNISSDSQRLTHCYFEIYFSFI